MRRALIPIVLAAFLAVPATPVLAQDETTPDELALEAFEKLKMAFELFLGSIPMYSTPELLPNGDIIIRRVNPDEKKDTPAEDGDAGTQET